MPLDEQGSITTDQISRFRQAHGLQRRRRQAGGVALVADEDHPSVGCRLRDAIGRRRIEPPLEVDALDDQRASELALSFAVGGRPDVHHHRAGHDLGVEVLRCNAVEISSCFRQEAVDR